MSCSREMVGIGYPIELEGLSIELDRCADSTSCHLKFEHECLQGAAIRYVNINKVFDLPCDTDPSTGWTYKYISYVTEYFVIVEICSKNFEEPEPEPEPEEGDLTDYTRISDNTEDIVDGAVSILGGGMAVIGGGVSDLHDYVTTEFASVTSGLSDLSSGMSGWIGDLQTNFTTQITGVTESLTGGFNTISDKIDGLSIPTLDNIKGAFLDVCADLASSLWDAILNKIEERYPKDDKESD